MQLVLDKFGRMVLPKAIRDDFGLEPGDLLDVEEQQECIVIRPARERQIVKNESGLLVFAGKAAGNLKNAVADHRRNRISRVSGERTG